MDNWKDNIRRVDPYVPGEQPKGDGIIKLNTNENPYTPALGVVNALKDLSDMNGDILRKYPDPDASVIIESIAKYHKVNRENVFVGVGSDDVLATAFLTFFNSDKPIIFPDITYSFYKVWADVYRIPYEEIPLSDDFTVNIGDYNRECGGIVIANPNAPTGVVLPLEDIETIVKNNRDVVVIIDEAYIDFGGESALKLIDKYENVLVTRTFSKSRSLAGLRLGYAMGSKELISAMLDVKFSINSYTINAPTLISASESIEDETYFRETVAKIVYTREEVIRELESRDFEVLPSSANFIFAKHKVKPAELIFEELKKRNIYVRYFKKPRIDNYLRITIGTEEEMEIFLEVIDSVINA
ncbi:histidinol-phosphate transaminase [Howardella ureilytica]|nr:histidinol-phosphate transaminase [Lachnospiraceae bacterium]MDY2956125.1 histidinol-phosphate transaminase [Lachnospiraceae bacterium]